MLINHEWDCTCSPIVPISGVEHWWWLWRSSWQPEVSYAAAAMFFFLPWIMHQA